MADTITLPKDFGYVMAVAASSGFFCFIQGFWVGAARQKAKVDYPAMCVYPVKTDAEKMYMCAQRAHQNMLETYPAFLAALATAGVAYPKAAAALGSAWVVGRMLYAHGYRTGDPNSRLPGSALALLSLAALIGMGTYGGIKIATS